MKKLMILMLIFLLAVPMFAAAENDRETLDLTFEDTGEGYWAQEYIERMKAKDVFQGYADGTFRPSESVTRMQTIVTAVRLLGLEEEAKAKDVNTPVFFKDADSYFGNGRNEWAKGYVLVALEQGLFDSSENVLAANQPAERVWVASMLVRALGLEDQAREAITVKPNFVDADQIPAGSIGYVNVASEYGIITGNQDGYFNPNQKITRAQMAAVLDRTYDGLLDEQGVTFVRGALAEHNAEEKSLTIEQAQGEQVLTYADDLLVLYKGRLIAPSQLQVGDVLSLYVLNNQVVEAEILDAEVAEQVVSQEIQEFEVEAEYANGNELEMNYKIRKGKVQAELEEEIDDEERKVKGERALAEIQAYVDQWALTADMSKGEIVSRITESLSTDSEFKKLEIEIKFSNGTKVKHKEKKEVDRGSYQGIHELELEVKTHAKDEIEWKYKHDDDGDVEAEMKSESDEGKEEKLKGARAQAAIEAQLDALALTDSMTDEEYINAVLAALELSSEDVKEVELKIHFESGIKVDLKKKNEKKEADRGSYQGVRELKVEIDTHDKNELEWKYKHEKNGKVEAEVKIKEDKGREQKLKGARAQAQIEAQLDAVSFTDSMTEDELVEAVLLAAQMDWDNVKEIKIEVQFDSGVKIEVDKKNDQAVEDDADNQQEEVEVVEEEVVAAR